ncbi:hypothetical protein ACFVMC_06040 [Nocardia sp. NPDC127579]|uniref:hypothetical protein n=1 Tax=Nocardia sp. NPDC127579 TaxID=3345402 RepID=UPI0036404276
MTLGRQLVSARSRNRLVAVLAVGMAAAVAWVLRSRRPQPPAVAPEPPRIGYSRNGSPQPVSLSD